MELIYKMDFSKFLIIMNLLNLFTSRETRNEERNFKILILIIIVAIYFIIDEMMNKYYIYHGCDYKYK